MKFYIDTETFKDLEIFNSRSETEPLFSLFNVTKTLGGSEKLLEMMQSPSSDSAFLNERKNVLSFLSNLDADIDITRSQLDFIEHYLRYNKSFLKNNFIDAVFDGIYNKINTTPDYYTIKTGIISIVKLAKAFNKFTEALNHHKLPPYLLQLLKKAGLFLSLKPVHELLAADSDKISIFKINKLDSFFRKREATKLRAFIRVVYELDVLLTIAQVKTEKGFCFADYVPSETSVVELKGLFHPQMTNPVKNDIHIKQDVNITFLTGPNMAGKSSLLKAIGLTVYLAHIGFPVPAEKMQTSVFNGLLTTINLPDNMAMGLSHYYSEVKRVKQTAQQILENKNMFIIFDELFRGTNVKDAYDASLLIISSLSAIKSSVFFISTHIVELAPALKQFKNITFKYLETGFDGERPVFSYCLKDGISNERLGMFIIRNEGIIDILKQASKEQTI